MTQTLSLSQLARASAVHVAAGFLVMVAWGWWVNRGHGAAPALIAGLAQGTLSGLLTLGLKRGLESLACRLSGAAALVLPPLTGFVLIAALLVTVHRLIGTPEILATVAFPLTFSTSYAVIYTALLHRPRRRAP
jgi:hypothetical protein